MTRFQAGERVVKSGLDLNYHGTVRMVIDVATFREALEGMHQINPENTARLLEQFAAIDPEYLEHPLYFVEPDDSQMVATFAQAKEIIPTITEEQYGLLVGQHRRMFLVIDSQLFPEEQS